MKRKEDHEFMNTHLRLKNFYHINSVNITQRLQKKFTVENQLTETGTISSEKLFLTIFEEIVNESLLFCQYILPDQLFPSSSFFNEPYSSDFKTLLALCKAAIFHHCVLYGFSTALKKTPLKNEQTKVKFNNFPHFISLTGATDQDIKRGYFSSSRLPVKPSENKDCTIFQKYYSLYYPRLQKHRDYYSHRLLFYANKYAQSSTPSSTAKSASSLTVPVCYSNPLLFLFTDPKVKNLDRALLADSSSTLITRFEEMENAANNWKQENLTSTMDSLLFEMIIEPAYGIEFFKDMSYLLCKIHTPSKSDTFTYNDLEGQAFVNTISNYVSTLPLAYNRSILIEYVCQAAMSSDNLNNQAYPPPADSSIGQRTTRLKQPKDSLVITALQRIGSFFRMFNYCTLPILEDLWGLVTNDEKLGITITLDLYVDFLTQNYSFITSNYISIYEQHPDFWQEELKRDFDFSRIYEKLKLVPANKAVNFPNLDSAAKKQLAFLIRKNCQIPVIPRHSIDQIILSQIEKERHQEDKRKRVNNCIQYEQFQKRHLDNIFHFLEEIDPSNPT